MQLIKKSSTRSASNVFCDDDADGEDDAEKQHVDLDLGVACLPSVKETDIDGSASDEEVDNSGVTIRLKNRKRPPTKRRKQVRFYTLNITHLLLK